MDTPFPKGRNRKEEGVTGPEQVPTLRLKRNDPLWLSVCPPGPPGVVLPHPHPSFAGCSAHHGSQGLESCACGSPQVLPTPGSP